MKVPPSFENARVSGQFVKGTKIMYSVGGSGSSEDLKDWKNTFATPEKAISLAHEVSQWKSDGIDIDFESGIGEDVAFSANLLIFAQELRRIRPDFIITQAVFGYP